MFACAVFEIVEVFHTTLELWLSRMQDRTSYKKNCKARKSPLLLGCRTHNSERVRQLGLLSPQLDSPAAVPLLEGLSCLLYPRKAPLASPHTRPPAPSWALGCPQRRAVTLPSWFKWGQAVQGKSCVCIKKQSPILHYASVCNANPTIHGWVSAEPHLPLDQARAKAAHSDLIR